jgi:hypothetical protein
MKTPTPTEVKVSALNSAIIGTFPKRCNTVRAEVLARLLRGERLTGLDGVYGFSTTRLSAAVHALIHNYGWHIESLKLNTGTNDGRVSEVCAYYLRQSIICAAMAAGAGAFIAEVTTQRKLRRKNAQKARREAERRNIARVLARIDPGQGDFFQVSAT